MICEKAGSRLLKSSCSMYVYVGFCLLAFETCGRFLQNLGRTLCHQGILTSTFYITTCINSNMEDARTSKAGPTLAAVNVEAVNELW